MCSKLQDKMTFYHKLTCIGEDPRYPNGGNWYRSENGFHLMNELGGPEALANLNDFVPRPNDVYVVSYPKTGTTWLQEIAYLIGTDLDFQSAKKVNIMIRCPYLEWRSRPTKLEDMPSPRFMKSHLPFSMIPQSLLENKSKILYTMRNPKDTVVSQFHFGQSAEFLNFNSNFEGFFDAFLEGKVPYGPYWKHCCEFVEQKHRDHIFVTTYEEMKMDLPSVIKKVAKFLEKSLTEDQVRAIEKHCGFDEMKKNPGTNPNLDPKIGAVFKEEISPFMRKGQIGDWKNHFTDDMNARMNEHIKKYFQGIDFVYE